MSQVLGLLDLAPKTIAAIDVPEEQAPKVKERDLRRIARLPEGKQMREWRHCLGTSRGR